MSTWLFRLVRLSRLIWVRAGLISLLAVVAAAVSPVISPLFPASLVAPIDIEATRRLLDILSTTMLTVTTFSLTVITAAHLSAAQAVTPRIHRLLREDGRTQTVLATFMGAFVYALVTTVLLNLRVHEKQDFGTVYIFTVLVIVLVIVAVLRWIQHLTTLGAMDHSIAMVADEAEDALVDWRRRPLMGGLEAAGGPPPDAALLPAPSYGFLQTIDLPKLDKIAAAHPGEMWLQVRPGDYVPEGRTLARLTGALAQADRAKLAAAFVLAESRTYTGDPAHGLIVLSEIASRALSPAVNDPRTAELVAIRMHGLLSRAAVPGGAEAPVRPWLRAPRLDPNVLFRMSFDPIARDGSGFVELQLRLQKLLALLARSADPGFAAAARAASARALLHAGAGLPLEEDLERVRAEAPA